MYRNQSCLWLNVQACGLLTCKNTTFQCEINIRPGILVPLPFFLQDNFRGGLTLLHDTQEVGSPHLAQVLFGQALSLQHTGQVN